MITLALGAVLVLVLLATTRPRWLPDLRRARHDYVPAFRHDALLPLYDGLQRLLGVPHAHRALLREAGIRDGDRVLEVGCGTGNLAVMAARRHPSTTVVAVDPGPRALARARRKSPAGEVTFVHGYGQALPHPEGSFDHVLCAFVLHHLSPEAKRGALAEVRRVLRPGGTLHLVDLGGEPPSGLPDAGLREEEVVRHRSRRLGHPWIVRARPTPAPVST